MHKSLIKEIKFGPNSTKTEHIYIKTKIATVGNVSLSSEIDEKNFNNDDIDIIRVKNRVSVKLDEFPNYRIDITCSYTLDNLLSVKNNKTKMLPPISNLKTLEQFIETAYQVGVVYEVEFERITRDNIDDVVVEVANIKKFFGDNANENVFLKEIALKLGLPKVIIYDKNFNFKRLGNRPVELNKNMYYNELYPNLENYYLTEKTDGKSLYLLRWVSSDLHYYGYHGSFRTMERTVLS